MIDCDCYFDGYDAAVYQCLEINERTFVMKGRVIRPVLIYSKL
jgi:hypothetical protein